MNRLLSFLVLPLASVFAFACSAPASEEAEPEVNEADIVGIGDLGTLESSLGLVWDGSRTRPEAVVRSGPCYQKMLASGREWNMRRYTTGAAFFFTGGSGEPLSPVSCVDVELMDGTKDGSGGRQRAVALTGLTLDIAIRFQLGRLQSFNGPQVGPDEYKFMSFERGGIKIVPIPSNMPYSLKENLPEYDGDFRGYITEIQSRLIPIAIQKTAPGIAMLAYRFAKASQSTSMASDPLGAFQAVDEVGEPSSFNVRFERGLIRAYPSSAPGDGMLTLDSNVSNIAEGTTDASCERRGGAEWMCWNSIYPVVPWEITGL